MSVHARVSVCKTAGDDGITIRLIVDNDKVVFTAGTHNAEACYKTYRKSNSSKNNLKDRAGKVKDLCFAGRTPRDVSEGGGFYLRFRNGLYKRIVTITAENHRAAIREIYEWLQRRDPAALCGQSLKDVTAYYQRRFKELETGNGTAKRLRKTDEYLVFEASVPLLTEDGTYLQKSFKAVSLKALQYRLDEVKTSEDYQRWFAPRAGKIPYITVWKQEGRSAQVRMAYRFEDGSWHRTSMAVDKYGLEHCLFHSHRLLEAVSGCKFPYDMAASLKHYETGIQFYVKRELKGK